MPGSFDSKTLFKRLEKLKQHLQKAFSAFYFCSISYVYFISQSNIFSPPGLMIQDHIVCYWPPSANVSGGTRVGRSGAPNFGAFACRSSRTRARIRTRSIGAEPPPACTFPALGSTPPSAKSSISPSLPLRSSPTWPRST